MGVSVPQIELHQPIRAPLDLVWKACVSPHGLANWQADEARGEARLGGKLTLRWPAFDATVELNVLDLVPYQRVVLSHGATTVEMRFEDNLVTLVQRGLSAQDDAEGLESSWRIALAQLAHCVERHPGRRRRVSWLVRSLRCSPESVYLCFTDPHLMDHWLTASGTIPRSGEPYQLSLKGGQRLRGTVLANVVGRDIALSCSKLGEAVLTLRTLPSPTRPGERLIALVWSEWGPPPMATDEILDELDGALDRLVGILGRCGRG